jgi:hypothetical protein
VVSAYIPVELRRLARERDRERCCYCLTTELNCGMRMVFDHMCPRAKGGATVLGNVCLACRSCNECKSDLVVGLDVVTGEEVGLFNPLLQGWVEHFEWSADGVTVVGKTAVGRVTVAVLQMNHGAIVAARRRWVEVGWHPLGEE